MTSLLFGVTTLDPMTYVTVSMVLILAAALASYLPSRRATTIDPVRALVFTLLGRTAEAAHLRATDRAAIYW